MPLLTMHSVTTLQVGPEAAQVLQDFYLDLRQKHRSPDSTPITTRQIESLIRLAEARARLELREEVTAADALDVVEIMRMSMIDTARCADSGRILHSRMPLDPTHVRLKRCHACDQ
jgi:DNA replicative helicase MCM subunit Mcm2 (Cdc46/Mcm family)